MNVESKEKWRGKQQKEKKNWEGRERESEKKRVGVD